MYQSSVNKLVKEFSLKLTLKEIKENYWIM